MRVGVTIDPGADTPAIDGVRRQAEAAAEVGLDLAWVREGSPGSTAASSATTLAAVVGAVTDRMRVAVQVGIGDHPVELAEELTVADLTIGGRLSAIVDARDGPDAGVDVLEETLTVLCAALAPVPFEHQGPRWTVNAGGPVSVTPEPAQLELPIHVLGAAHAAVARSHGVPPIIDINEDADHAARVWEALSASLGVARHRWARVARRDPTVHANTDAAVASLRREAATWALGTVVYDLARLPSLDDRLDLIGWLGRNVRPRVQLASLPDGVEAMWVRRAGSPSAIAHGDAP